MALPPDIRRNLVLPAICAPMFLASTPPLVVAACKAGLIGALPRGNFRSIEEFGAALASVREELNRHRDAQPHAIIGPVAVNIPTDLSADDTKVHLELCRENGVDLYITATGNPTETIRRVRDFGGRIFCDAISMRFAEKAIGAGADGIVAIGAGGGGHSGPLSPLVLVARIRAIFGGTIVLAGCVSDGAAIRAAEVLGADLAYLGTRFIATRESGAPTHYKELLVSQTSGDLIYTAGMNGVPCNWLAESIREAGLDPFDLPRPTGKLRYDHLPPGVRPWKTVWSAGQGIDLIRDIPSVEDLVQRLRREYVTACSVPSMADVARLKHEAGEPARERA